MKKDGISESGDLFARVEFIVEDGIAEVLRELATNLVFPACDNLHAYEVAPKDI